MAEVDNRDDAVRVAMHLQDCARTLTGETRELEIVHGANARYYASQVMQAYGLGHLEPDHVAKVKAKARTIDAQVKAFLYECRALKPRTQAHYADYLGRFVKFTGETMSVDAAMSRDTLRRFAKARVDKIKAFKLRVTDGKRGANQDRQILLRFGNWLVNQEIIASHGVKQGIEKKRETPAKRELLTKTEKSKVLAAALAFDAPGGGNISYVKWHAALTLLMESGIRIGELLNLQWGDVVLEGDRAPMLAIRVKDGWQPKSGEARDLPLRTETAELLRAWRDSIPKKKWRDFDAYLMTWQKERPRRLKDPGKQAKAIFRAAGIPWRGFHITRHTFAVECIRSKAFDILQVKQMLGHSDIETTMAYLRWADTEELVTTGRDKIPAAA